MRGFEYLVYSAVSFVLLLVLVLLPVAPAFASEEVTEGVTGDAPTEQFDEPQVEEAVEAGEVPEPGAEDAGTSPATEEEPVEDAVVDVATGEAVLAESPEGDSSAEVTEAGSGEVELAEGILEETATTIEEVLEAETEETNPKDDVVVGDGSGTTTEEVLGAETGEETPEDEVGTTTEEVEESEEASSDEEILELEDTEGTSEESDEFAEENLEEPVTDEENLVVVESAATDGNPLSFTEEECISVGDGSFYCSSATTTPAILGTDRVFSAVDADGDKEIYVEKGGEVNPVTDNLLDDDAPYYDERSETIVWHRLVEGRYQIVSFSIDDGEETVLTADRYNNMEPSRYGDLTVWQGWIGNDWEIMLEEDGEISMLTDNTYHDIAPHINGAYVVWQSFEGGGWRVKVYDTITEETTTIDDAEGASVENPRFVLVYDRKEGNGDVETRGYDLKSKEAVPLSATPAPTPESIPDPDQTGEDRALIQTVTQQKPKGEGELDTDEVTPPVEPETDNGTTTVAFEDVIVPIFEGTGTTTETLPDEVVSGELDESTDHIEDVVIPVTEETVEVVATTTVDHIEDIIVTPFVEPIEELQVIQLD